MEGTTPDNVAIIILCFVVGGFLTGYTAYIKARKHPLDWSFYGAFLPFIALPHIMGAESLPVYSEHQIAVRKLILRIRWVFYFLACVYFYGFVTVMDRVTDTEELFPNTDGRLVAAVFFILTGWITAAIAFDKGRNNIGGWFLYGTLLFLPAIPHSVLVDSRPKMIELRRSEKRV